MSLPHFTPSICLVHSYLIYSLFLTQVLSYVHYKYIRTTPVYSESLELILLYSPPHLSVPLYILFGLCSVFPRSPLDPTQNSILSVPRTSSSHGSSRHTMVLVVNLPAGLDPFISPLARPDSAQSTFMIASLIAIYFLFNSTG